MFVHTGRTWCGLLIGSALSLALASLGGAAGRTDAATRGRCHRAEATAETQAASRAGPAAAPAVAATAPVTPAAQLNAKADAFDAARSNLFTTTGTMTTSFSHATVEALPGSTNTPVERLLLQFPGVSQDSAVSRRPSRPQRPRQRSICG